MIDLKEVRKNPDLLKRVLLRANTDLDIDEFINLDGNRRKLIFETENLKSQQNVFNKQIPVWKREGKDISGLLKNSRVLSDKVGQLNRQLKEADEKIDEILMQIPNIPALGVPVGNSDEDNKEVRRWKEPSKFDFEPRPHWDIGESMGILDFETAGKITGSRFTVYRGAGARLERALINFMLDLHIENHGYMEILPPFMVNRKSMTGTGQLPKFEDDAFKVMPQDYFLVPTAEVPVTNLHGNQILNEEDLPIYYTAYTPCFRAEAGSAGRDTRGLIRQHQFNKVELVKFTLPDNSYDELEKLTNDAEEVLKLLGLPYRVVLLCTGDLGFSSAMTYDLEVWMPSYNRYVEISSCSNFEGFQARRAGIRFRRSTGGKTENVHTINGSGLAVGRTTAAILENFQRADGSVEIPEVLEGYLGGRKVIGGDGKWADF